MYQIGDLKKQRRIVGFAAQLTAANESKKGYTACIPFH